jgi:D-alanyl-lipoteichoic acid acyltransferase DltB (MBOAT superfamily)
VLFNSLEFGVFLIVVYALYLSLPFRGQNWLLLVSSYIFYGWWDWRFLFLMIFSTSIDFWTGLVLDRGRLRSSEIIVPAVFLSSAGVVLLGLNTSVLFHGPIGAASADALVTPMMPYVIVGIPTFLAVAALVYHALNSLNEEQRRRGCMILSIVAQLTVLGFFKYFNFFAQSLTEALASVGLRAPVNYLHIVLPVGISFYTFQSMSYAIDIYRREIKPTHRFFDFALFVSFFPQLVAGPIERARNLLPQMSLPRSVTWDQVRRGTFLIVLGLFKKIAIADGIAGTVDTAFAVRNPSWLTVAVGTTAFAVQIYTDFSGYSDIARGVAKLFGVELMQNFNLPYFARSPREFWQRWHISLSTWLSDYLYRPLGGNRGTLAFTCRNLMLTMVLGGLWHGAAWNYVLWGFYQGAVLTGHRVLQAKVGPPCDSGMKAILKICGFGVMTLYGWLLFRARSFSQIETYTSILLTGRGGFSLDAARPGFSAALGVMLLAAWEIAQYRSGDGPKFYRGLPAPLVGLAVAAMVFLTLMGMSNEPAQFIYFQF